MKVQFTITAEDLRRLIADHFADKTGKDIDADSILIEVKSKQNYRSEWEVADFRATYRGDI